MRQLIKKGYLFLILPLALVSCYTPTHPDIIVIGDSLCEGTHDSFGQPYPQIMGVDMNCVGGRPATQLAEMPQGFKVIFYALGSNDISKSTLEEYKTQIQYHFASVAADVHCILPDNKRTSEKAIQIRQALIDNCPGDIIEPRDYGYYFSANDGIHGTASDHNALGAALRKKYSL